MSSLKKFIITLCLGALMFSVNIPSASANESLRQYIDEIKTTRLTAILISKSSNTLTLFRDGVAVITCRAVFGVNPNGDKERMGDNRTPEGHFYIVDKERLGQHPYLGTKWLGLSYPDIKHADLGLRNQLINHAQHQAIVQANKAGYTPPQQTSLGGYIGIHGGNEELTKTGVNWTEGCIALLESDLEYVFTSVPVGTTVIITA